MSGIFDFNYVITSDENTHILHSVQKKSYSKKGSIKPRKSMYVNTLYLMSGNIKIHHNNNEYSMKKGDVFFVDKNSFFGFDVLEESVVFSLTINNTFLKNNIPGATCIYDVFDYFVYNEYSYEHVKNQPIISLIQAQISNIDELIQKFQNEINKKNTNYQNVIELYAHMFLINLIRTLHSEKLIKIPQKLTSQIINYIEANYTRSTLSVTELANKCYYNPAHIGKLFKAEFGDNIRSYITKRRLEYAKYLLINTNKSTETIAFEVGFDNKSFFHKQFIKIVGCTPSQYRKNNTNII